MRKLTFRGGVHPFDGKSLTRKKRMKEILPKGDLVYPLSQHIGAPAVPVVSKGERVLAGQMIAQAQGFVSASVYASVSGVVKAIEPRRVANGDKVMSIVISNDLIYEEYQTPPVKPFEEMSREDMITAIQNAGIVGMGGAGFPTHVKLCPKEPEKIEYVIANCAECEPYLTSDYRRMIEEPDKLIDGMKVMLKLFPNAKAILAVEDNKKDCIRILKEKTKDEAKIKVAVLRTKYPQGSERHLIHAVTGRKINSSMLPSDVGCIVDNVDTIVAINYAVREGKPLLERIVTITGDAIAKPRNFYIKIGTSYSELVEAAGGFKVQPEKIISGGPMMGFAMFDLNVPTTKITSALLCMAKDEVSACEPSACINCGRCAEVCPGRVIPKLLAECAEKYDLETFEKYDGLECCECGCCSYICPAKRPLTQAIKSARKLVLAEKKKKQEEK